MGSIINIQDNSLDAKCMWEEIDNIIYKTYINLFDLLGCVPSVTAVFNKIDYEFDTKAYDIVYGVNKDQVKEETIMTVLLKRGCIFSWGGIIVNDAQQMMFEALCSDSIDVISFENKVIGINS